jgi:hypothetical protein
LIQFVMQSPLSVPFPAKAGLTGPFPFPCSQMTTESLD